MFIVIEGIDGAGCETQAKRVSQLLTTNYKLPTSLIKFPHYDTPVGKMIKDFLYLNQKMKAHEQFLLYTLQFIFDAQKIKPFISTNYKLPTTNYLIADRYFTTTLCYQTLEGFDEAYALSYAKMFRIVKPDLVFFLDVKPETAIKWKYGEGKELNFREKDLDFMKKTYKKYQDLITRQVWAKWIRINGEQDKQKVTEEIIKRLTL
jgi:dTMP kinase